jgi:uncharacterized NAD-dependent epimerase/dehydratase family protein
MRETAVILANGLFHTAFAKTAHGMVRGPCRYRILGIVDSSSTNKTNPTVPSMQKRSSNDRLAR